MADLWSIISANYKTVGLTVPSKTPYVAVDPKLYEGTWTGKYADNKTFKITVSNVTGFRAKVQYQSGGTNKYQEVLIKDHSFRIGDTKFTLTALGKRRSRTSSPIRRPGQTYLDQAYATRSELTTGVTRSGLAVGGAKPRRRVLGQVERVEIGAAAQHGFLGKLLHHLARPGIDDLIDDRRGRRDRSPPGSTPKQSEIETRTAAESCWRARSRRPPRRSGSPAVRSRPHVCAASLTG